MAKAKTVSSTSSDAVIEPFKVTNQTFKYFGPGKVKVTCTTETGEVLSYIISPALLIESIDAGIAFVNDHARLVLSGT